MKTTTEALEANDIASAGRGFRSDDRPGHARAFGGESQSSVEVQARVRFRKERERASLVVNGVLRARAMQILDAVLRLPAVASAGVELGHLRIDLHRGDSGRWSHHYSLATAISMVSSLVRRAVPADYLFIGDVDLGGSVRDVPAAIIDASNDAVESFAIETPVTIVLAADSATWVRASSTVRVLPCRSLAQAVAATWPSTALIPC